ncbi:lytic transglycosylase domain-containing protein [Bartonella henselae]|uniref:lytic transglycosylase domain-containing protein n=1 Tax=Bartonella henselae TaxID=38323 RepID=UPI000967BB9A|nr:lytic transglycosylase domain-containing protein [Bartonella henselae]OLL55926.1 trwN protein [Bartonella henselae]OLL56043.1 trwN protein [Bartonella henselae]UJM32337.1 lytic transglycosylase domain-containing protein [Bartonella henselae]
MTIPGFMMFAAACAPAIHPTTFSAVVIQESLDYISVRSTNDDPKVSRQSSMFEETVATAEQFKQCGRNFDISLRQINVRNLEYFRVSLSDLFNLCETLKAIQAVVTHCSEREKLEYSSEKTTLQSVLSFYNTKSFKGTFSTAYVQKVASHIGVQVSASPSQKSQESIELSTEQPEQIIETKTFPPSSEDLEDAFTHNASSVGDAFTTEDSSLTVETSSSFGR